ncbi:MAG: DUF6785 family protein [Thermoproteota archaeon]
MASEKVEVEKLSLRVWVYLMLYIAVISAFTITLTLFLPQPYASGFNMGPSSGFMYILFPYAVSLILMLLAAKGWIKLDMKTIALIYVASSVAVWYSNYKGMFALIDSLFQVRISTAANHGYAVPFFWIPSEAAVRGMFYHGSLGNLFVTYASEWVPVALTWITYYITSALYFLGIAALLRRLWVDIEVLPFPHAQGVLVAEVASAEYISQTAFLKRRKLIAIAAVIGVLIWIPYMLRGLSPSFPDLYGWITSPYYISWATGSLILSNQFPFLQQLLPFPVLISTDPLRYAFLLLAPLDTLFSWWLTYLIMRGLIPYILFYLGYYPSILQIGGSKGVIQTQPPYYLLTIAHGIFLGVFVFLIAINWKYFLQAIKLAISDKTPEGEVSYRVAFAMILLGAIGWLILFTLSTGNFLMTFLALIIVTLQTVTMIRLRAYTSQAPPVRGIPFWKIFLPPTTAPAPEMPGWQLFLVSHTQMWGSGSDTWGPYLATLGGSLDNFKVASMTKVHPKTILKLMVVGSIVATVVTAFVELVELHAWGHMEVPVTKEWDFTWTGDAGTYNPVLGLLSIHGAIGFILAGIVALMRVRFAWWPIEICGFAAGASWDWTDNFVGGVLVVFIAWLIKYVTLKIGGRKVFEEVVLPIAIGEIAGEALGVILTGLLTALRLVILKA